VRGLGHARLAAAIALRLGRDAAADLAFRLLHRPVPLCAPPPGSTTALLDAIRRAIARGCDFLRRSQRTDGSLRGFLLLPGASDAWLTAHAAFVLEDVAELAPLCERAARFLEDATRWRDGWGYNHLTRSDLDTTCQALMVLVRRGLPPPLFTTWLLVRAQSASGGFPTYPPSGRGGRPANEWEEPHPDVTLLVTEMLRRLRIDGDARPRALDWLDTQRLAQGTYRPRWWTSPAYSLWAQAKAGLATCDSAALTSALLPLQRTVPFLPMLLSAAASMGCDGEVCQDAARRLLARQLRDGSWSCVPCLRSGVLGTGIAESLIDRWRDRVAWLNSGALGAVHADWRRIFSTAHAVAALHAVREHVRLS